MAKKSMKAKIADAVSAATKKSRSAAAKARAQLKKARENDKARKAIGYAENVAGAAIGGAIHGAGVWVDAGETEVPIALIAGVGGVIAGEVMGQPDIGDVGLGMACFGAGRLVEDLVSDRMQSAGAEAAA